MTDTAREASEWRAARVFRSDVYEREFGPASTRGPVTLPVCDGIEFDGASVAD